MKINPNIIIFSVFQLNQCPTINNNNHQLVVKKLTRLSIPFLEVEGVYKNQSELSFLVPMSEAALVEGLCAFYNQESYLISDSNRFTSLVMLPFKELIHLGQLTASEIRPNREAYTYNPKTKIYYYTK